MREHVGVAGMGLYFPEEQYWWSAEKVAEISGMPVEAVKEKIGFTKKPMPGPQDTTSYMGIQAAKAAIKDAGIDPKDIDVVIWDGAQHKDHPCWLAFAKVCHEIGATRAWGLDMESMCGSRVVGLEIGKSLALANKNINTVLLVSGYRNCDLVNHEYKDLAFLFDIGAGGSAVVLQKNLGRNEVLSSAGVTDGSFSEDFVVPVAGTAKWPMEPEDVNEYWLHIVGDPKDFKTRLNNVTMKNWYYCIDQALELSGYTRKDIGYLAMVKIKRSGHMAILSELGLREDQSFLLEDYGHVGQNDVTISMVEGLQRGLIKDGTVVVLVSAGGGWTWGAGVVKWGPVQG
ncbi:MAG: 3-oxoacyl-ACP synthase [Peptococcia bacterium]